MNTIGPAGPVAGSPDFPQEWLKYQISRSAWYHGLAGIRAFTRTPGSITYRTFGNETHYGVGHHRTSFYETPTHIVVPSNKPSTEELDLALYLGRSKYGEPLTLHGTDAFKGAALARAIELGITVGNPELQTLQGVLSKQRNGTRVRPNQSGSQEQSVQQTPDLQATTETLRTATEDRLRALFPEGNVHEAPLPSEHEANETRLYQVVKADANGFSIKHDDDGAYSLWKRTAGTQDLNDGDWVSVQTGPNREVAAIAAHTLMNVPKVEEGPALEDPIATLQKLDPKANVEAIAESLKKTAQKTQPPQSAAQTAGAPEAKKPIDALWDACCAATDPTLTIREAEPAEYRALYEGKLANGEFVTQAVNEYGAAMRDGASDAVYLVPRRMLPNPETLEIGKTVGLQLNGDGTLRSKELLQAPVGAPAQGPDLHATVAAGGYESIPTFTDMTRSMLGAELGAMAREYLSGAMGKDPNTIRQVDFGWPDGNVSRTILAANDLGFAVAVPNGKHGAYMFVERDKVPFPSGCNQLEPGQKLSFKTVNGVKTMVIPKAELEGVKRTMKIG